MCLGMHMDVFKQLYDAWLPNMAMSCDATSIQVSKTSQIDKGFLQDPDLGWTIGKWISEQIIVRYKAMFYFYFPLFYSI